MENELKRIFDIQLNYLKKQLNFVKMDLDCTIFAKFYLYEDLVENNLDKRNLWREDLKNHSFFSLYHYLRNINYSKKN